MVGERHPVAAQSDQDAEEHDAESGSLQGKQQAESGDGQGRAGNLPLALEDVGELPAQQRAQRAGQGDDEGIAQGLGDGDAFGEEQSGNPTGETVVADRLQDVEDGEEDGASAVTLAPNFLE